MGKDRVKGMLKDIAGRAQRQSGEWTGDTETQAKGAAKQAEGKIQNALGQSHRVKNSSEEAGNEVEIEGEDEPSLPPRRRAS